MMAGGFAARAVSSIDNAHMFRYEHTHHTSDPCHTSHHSFDLSSPPQVAVLLVALPPIPLSLNIRLSSSLLSTTPISIENRLLPKGARNSCAK